MFFIFELFNWLFKPSEKVTKGLAQAVVNAKPKPPQTAPEQTPTTVPVAAPSAAKQFGKILNEK